MPNVKSFVIHLSACCKFLSNDTRGSYLVGRDCVYEVYHEKRVIKTSSNVAYKIPAVLLL